MYIYICICTHTHKYGDWTVLRDPASSIQSVSSPSSPPLPLMCADLSVLLAASRPHLCHFLLAFRLETLSPAASTHFDNELTTLRS